MTKPIVAGLLLCAIVMLVAHLEYRFAPVEEAVRADPPQTVFHRPLPCDVIVSQRGAGEPWISKCYYTTQSKQ